MQSARPESDMFRDAVIVDTISYLGSILSCSMSGNKPALTYKMVLAIGHTSDAKFRCEVKITVHG